MGQTYNVRLEPVGIEFEVDEDETILDGAFRQGLMLMHGCKEGQCAACKSFLLDGEVDMDKYSTFALPDYEQDEGWTLLCKAHAVSDLEIELINYDEEILRSGVALRTVSTRVEAIEPLTRDIRRLVLQVTDGDMPFHPGQYVDIRIPGTDEHRSFSMANVPNGDGRLEFMIKLYPGGRFSGLLAEGGLSVGDELEVKGPYGVFTLRESDRPLVFIGGGAGMAPILSLLRAMTRNGVTRQAVYYYGAREEADLFHLDELTELTDALADFRFVPALSHGDWGAHPPGAHPPGETGLITEVVDQREADLAGVDAYLCGPPPMVDAAIELLKARGLSEQQIFFDKFTTTAETEESSRA
jgi:propane monooxygenase reductase subunit